MVSNITVVDNETIEIDEGEYYLLLVLLNGSTDTTSCNEADEGPFAENYFEEQGDEDSVIKLILGIKYHTFYDFKVYWYLVGKI